MYEAFYDAIMNALSEICEDAWSPALQRAWKTSLELTRDRVFNRTTENLTIAPLPDSPFDFVNRRVHGTALIVDDDEQVRKTSVLISRTSWGMTVMKLKMVRSLSIF